MTYIRLFDYTQNAGSRQGEVLNKEGNPIGEAHDSTYHGRAYAVHTKDYAGFTPLTQIEFIDAPENFQ